MQTTRQLFIDGDEITFAIELSGQAMAVSEGAKMDSPEPFLGATVTRNGKKVWSGILSRDVTPLVPISEQFSDQDLERLYRQVRAAG